MEAALPFTASFFAGTPSWKYHGGESITSLRMQCQYALPLATRSWILVCHSLRGVATSMTFQSWAAKNTGLNLMKPVLPLRGLDNEANTH